MDALRKIKFWLRKFCAPTKLQPELTLPPSAKAVQGALSSDVAAVSPSATRRISVKRKSRKKTRNPSYSQGATVGYKSRGDGTEIDRLVSHLEKVLPEGISYSVSGLSTIPRKSQGQLEWISIVAGSRSKCRWIKNYKVGLLFSSDVWGLESLVKELREYEVDGTDDFYQRYRRPIADRIYSEILGAVGSYDPGFKVTAGIKSDGKVSAWVDVRLPICVHDLVVHCGGDLTDFPGKHLDEFEVLVEKLIGKDVGLFVNIYKDYDVRYKFMRRAEQAFRKQQGAPRIGEGFVTQFSLYKMVKKEYPNAIYEYSPKFLKGQRYDIYIPSLRIAIEYNGPQHYEPVEIYGGEGGFDKTIERDKRKIDLSSANNVSVVEWPYTRPVTAAEVELFLGGIKAH